MSRILMNVFSLGSYLFRNADQIIAATLIISFLFFLIIIAIRIRKNSE